MKLRSAIQTIGATSTPNACKRKYCNQSIFVHNNSRSNTSNLMYALTGGTRPRTGSSKGSVGHTMAEYGNCFKSVLGYHEMTTLHRKNTLRVFIKMSRAGRAKLIEGSNPAEFALKGIIVVEMMLNTTAFVNVQRLDSFIITQSRALPLCKVPALLWTVNASGLSNRNNNVARINRINGRILSFR